MSDAFQIHVSGLLTMSDCGERFRRRYIEGEKIPPGIALGIGSTVHKTVGADLSEKIRTGALLSSEAITDLARDNAVSIADAGLRLDEDETQDSAKAEMIDTATALATLHHDVVAPTINPIYVERPFALDMTGMDVQLVGTIDVQEAKAILDTKTSGKSPSADEADKSLQLTMYALAHKASEGVMPESVRLDYLVKTKTPKYVGLASTRTPADFGPLFARIENAQKMIETGMFTPANPSWYGCSARHCGFFSSCPYSVRPVTVSAGVNRD